MTDIRLASPDAYAHAADILARGGLVALPTETVYGLAGDARSDSAVSRIYAVKGRPAHNPLIAHVLAPKDAALYANISPLADKLIAAFWPGPLTLVLPKQGDALSSIAGVGLETQAIRCPDTPWTSLMKKNGFDGPLFMPSANLSGRVSPTQATHVAADLGDRVDLIIDGGPCPGGIESTVIKIDDNKATLLRPGIIPDADFAPYIDQLYYPETNSQISAPGMLTSHYAPNAALRLNARDKRPGEPYLGFGPTDIEADYTLSATGDLAEAARNLYAALRALDTAQSMAVAPIPEHGLGCALNDRLRRAAAPR